MEGGTWLESERIGLMGGSFNPIHHVHVEMARIAMKEAGLHKVLFLPTGNPPHKRDGLAAAGNRFKMVQLALAAQEDFFPSDIEMNRNGIVYTVDTLSLLHQQLPSAKFYYIIGEDTLYNLLQWRNPERVFQMCRFLVCPRPYAKDGVDAESVLKELKRQGAVFSFLPVQAQELSSSGIRDALSSGGEPVGLNPAVMEYIRVMGIYGIKESPEGFAPYMEQLSNSMSLQRFAHTLCVSYTARKLAALHGADEQKAALAGLLHDCAKGMGLLSMQEYACRNGLVVEKSIFASGALLHASVGAHMAQREYGVTDVQVQSAIARHTLGDAPMTKLDMIVYLADKIEPCREHYHGLDEIRQLAQKDLAAAMALSLEQTQAYVKGRGKELHPASARTLQWLHETKKANNDWN